MQQIKQKVEELNKKREELNNLISLEFSKYLSEEMSKINELDSISFSCYTPYFNDGDECVYSVNTDYADFYDKDGEPLNYFIDYKDKELSKEELIDKYGESYINAYNVKEEIINFLNMIPMDFYMSTFGDHVLVTINKDGSYKTESYDHE